MTMRQVSKILKKSYLHWLMPSVRCNLTGEGTGFIFAVQSCFSPRSAFWHTAVCTMHSSWAYHILHIHLCWQRKNFDLVVALLQLVLVLCFFFFLFQTTVFPNFLSTFAIKVWESLEKCTHKIIHSITF